jgi:predicted alpha/beta-hydrolase family hydrolase
VFTPITHKEEVSMRALSLVMVLVGLVFGGVASASDLEKEKRWAEQVVDALLDGEAVYLNDGRAEFLALETESAAGDSKKAAIVMHGTGVHPNWPTVVLPLRVRLTESGWHTLSIQMPVLANEAEHGEYAKIYDWIPGRLDAAVDYLRGKGFEKVVLIGHSQGAGMTAFYLAGEHRPVDGFVAVGMSGGIPGGPMDNLGHLPAVTMPMLDLYGSEDLPEVLKSAADRASQAGKAGGDYVQQRVEGADHFFDGEEDELLAAVNAWLDERY